FTGYLLPWDQKAYWATVVGTHIVEYVPVVGNFLLEILRGQAEVGVRTLGRFYAAHTLFLPAILFILVTIHLFMVIKQGIAPLPLKKFATVKREEYADLYQRFKEKGRPFYENITKDAVVAFVLLILLIIMAVSLGAPLEEEADPTSVTYVPRPEWYFFFLFELLWWAPGKWIPIATFWVPTILLLALIFLPWLDRSIHRHPFRRPLAVVLAVSFSIIAAFLTYKGATAPKPPTVVTEVEKRAVAEALPPLALKGSGLYEEQGCAVCHTINGAGGAAGPDLSKAGRYRNTEWLKVFIKDPTTMNPDSEMPAYDWLSEEELEALSFYLSRLK
ncbi:MAG: cytochrome b N-terminal domain-containing protein, partial [Fidelibacterota bacterium]